MIPVIIIYYSKTIKFTHSRAPRSLSPPLQCVTGAADGCIAAWPAALGRPSLLPDNSGSDTSNCNSNANSAHDASIAVDLLQLEDGTPRVSCAILHDDTIIIIL